MSKLTIQCRRARPGPPGLEYEVYPARQSTPVGEIVEGASVVFRLRAANDVDIFQVALEVNDEVLARVALSSHEAEWEWRIGFHAGFARVRLSGVARSVVELEVETDAVQAKLTREEYARMVGDILTDTLALVALSGHRVGVGRGTQSIGIAKLEFLQNAFERIDAAVREIDQTPWLKLERDVVDVPIGRSRGITGLGLAAAARSGRMEAVGDPARLTAPVRRLAEQLGGQLPPTIPRRVAREQVRRREHEDMLAVLHMWSSFLQSAGRGLAALPENRVTPAVIRMRRDVAAMLVRIRRLQELPLFAGIEATRGSPTASHIFRRVPPYRRFFKAYQDFRAGISEVEGDFLNVPVHRTYDLYEVWCFLRLAHAAALDAGDEARWKDAVREQLDETRLVLRLEGLPLRFKSYTLLFKQQYLEVWRPDGPGLGSLSFRMVPDIAIEQMAGAGTSVLILDAKYRIEAGLEDAVRSIHVYRDALVRATAGPGDTSFVRAVNAAFVLTPQLTGVRGPEDWRKERTPAVFLRTAYRDTFRFGAVTFKPGVSVEDVRTVLEQLVRLAAAS